MVREYIGARYVPKFMGAYDVTQEYEALCVVDNGSGTSYITKIPTPAGTPLTDTSYWAIYGASSGAIVNLQNQIDDINADIGDIDNLTTEDNANLVGAVNSVDNIIKGVFVTPEMYGAIGDGVADDTQAVTDAIASGKMVVCKGTYLITSMITLPNNACIVAGESYTYNPTFKTTNGGFTVSGSTRHITLKGIYAISTGSGETFFLYPSGQGDRHIIFDDVRIDDYAIGFDIQGTLWDSTFNRVRVNNSTHTDYGFKFAAANSFNIAFNQCYFDGGLCEFNSITATFTACNFAIVKTAQYKFNNSPSTFIGCNFECDEHISTSGTCVQLYNGAYVAINCAFYLMGDGGAIMLDTSSSTRLLKLIAPLSWSKTGNNGMVLYRQTYMEQAYPGSFQIEGVSSAARYTDYGGDYLKFSPLLPSTIIQDKASGTAPRSTLRYNYTNNRLEFTPDGTTWKYINFDG